MATSAQSLQGTTIGVLLRFWRSSIGKKYVMAITGLGLFIFVIAHMLGNLQIFLGPEAINDYAEALKSIPALLWSFRIGLLAITILHITAAIQLVAINRRARPVNYQTRKIIASNFANRTMFISGLILLAFIIFHLAHFTLGLVNQEYLDFRDPLDRPDVYRMMITGFSNPLVSFFYIVSMGLLMLHLSHGVSSTFQSVGLRSKRVFGFLDKLARISALVIFIANCSIPLAILAGWIT
jgi:succinate dehydrogenase cytochrome b subunit